MYDDDFDDLDEEWRMEDDDYRYEINDEDDEDEGPTTWDDLVFELGEDPSLSAEEARRQVHKDKDHNETDTPTTMTSSSALNQTTLVERVHTSTGKGRKGSKKATMRSNQKFDPIQHIVERYAQLPYHRLREKVVEMHSDLDVERNALQIAMKDSLTQYVRSRVAIERFRDASTRQGALSLFQGCDGPQLLDQVHDVSSFAHNIFDSLLEARAKSERIRNALEVMKRFNFLFQIPRSMTLALEQVDYERLVHDFRKVESMSALSELPVFCDVFQEVYRIASLVRERIHTQLMDPLVPFSEKERCIGFLYVLRSPKDPIEEYLRSIEESLREELHTLSQSFNVLHSKSKSLSKRLSLERYSLSNGFRERSVSISEADDDNREEEDDGELSHRIKYRALSLFGRATGTLRARLPELAKFMSWYTGSNITKLLAETHHGMRSDTEKEASCLFVLDSILLTFDGLVKKFGCLLADPNDYSQANMREAVTFFSKLSGCLRDSGFREDHLRILSRSFDTFSSLVITTICSSSHAELIMESDTVSGLLIPRALDHGEGSSSLISETVEGSGSLSILAPAVELSIAHSFEQIVKNVSKITKRLLESVREKSDPWMKFREYLVEFVRFTADRMHSIAFAVKLRDSVVNEESHRHLCLAILQCARRLKEEIIPNLKAECRNAFRSLELSLDDSTFSFSNMLQKSLSMIETLENMVRREVVRAYVAEMNGVLLGGILLDSVSCGCLKSLQSNSGLRNYVLDLVMLLVEFKGDLVQFAPGWANLLLEDCLTHILDTTRFGIKKLPFLSFEMRYQFEKELKFLQDAFLPHITPECDSMIIHLLTDIESGGGENYDMWRRSQPGTDSITDSEALRLELNCFTDM